MLTGLSNGYEDDTTPRSTSSFAVQVGDVVVVKAAIENGVEADGNASLNISYSGSGVIDSWNRRIETGSGSNASYATAWTASVTTAGSITVTITKINGAAPFGYYFGAIAEVWRGSDGIGNVVTEADDGQPSEAISTTQSNSALSFWFGDWNAQSGTQTGTVSGGGSVTDESSYPGDSTHYGVYNGYVADGGSTGSHTVGMSAPTSQQARGGVIEIKGQ